MNGKLFDDSSVTEDNRPICGTKVAYAKKNGEEEAGRNCMNKRRLTNDALSKVRQAAIERPRYYQTKPDLLLAICDELIAYRASGFTSVEVRGLADAQEQGRILFAINDDDETHVSSQLERV